MMPTLRDKLMARLSYDRGTGLFHWLMTESRKIKAGDEAGCLFNGHIQINILGRVWRASRLAWLFETGQLPPKGFDVGHRNLILSDNRWENLILATRAQTVISTKRQREDNTTGERGVHYRRDTGRWFARVQKDGVLLHLGQFSTRAEAIAARLAEEKRLYGEFAPKRV